MSRDISPHPTAPTPPPRGDGPQNWAERGIGGKWQYRFVCWLMRVGGKARGYHIANFTAAWYVLFRPSIRRRCRFYLRRRFPEHSGWWRRLLDTFRLVRSYGATLVDMKVLEIFGPSALTARSPQHEKLVEISAQPRGLVVLQAHVGCWQIGMSTLGEFSKHVSIVMIPEDQTLALFAAKTPTAIDPRTGLGCVMNMTEALLRGEIVTMMGDRTFGGPQTAVAVRFLGGTAEFPVTPYRLASATGCPVLVLLAPKIGHGAYEVRLAKIIEVPPNLGRDPKNYAQYAQQFADCVEQFAMEFPWQLFNFYDLWAESNTTVRTGE
jgi:predicted LPLAT superfamily acyltransferase